MMYELSEYPGFERCVEMIRDPDALLFETGFWWLVDRAPEHTAELIALVRGEADPFTRGKFVELLGATHAPEALPVLAAELEHPDPHVREWALLALDDLGVPGAAELAAAYRQAHPELDEA